MKTIYKQPDCEIIWQNLLAVLCASQEAMIDNLDSDAVDDGDYEPLY